MSRTLKIGALTVLMLVGLLAINATVATALLAQAETRIEGTVTGINSTEDPPVLTVTTDSGASYVLRAPSFASVAGAQIGSKFRATGSVVGGTFIATSIQLADADSSLPPEPLAGGQTGVITGMDTVNLPPRLLVDTGAGAPLLLELPGAERVSDIQLGATVSFTGSPRPGAFQVSEWVVLSYPSADNNDNQ